MESLYLFSSARAMKQFFAQNYANDFLPSAMSIGAFFDYILRVDKKRKIPSFLRAFYLYRAIKQSNTQKLGAFAKNFTQFLQNSSFFFKFYDELCAECVDITALENLDIYAFYDEHLQVLKDVFSHYQNLLAEAQFFDKYFLEKYCITLELLQEFCAIILQVDGFLSRFEMAVLCAISNTLLVRFKLFIDPFNKEYYAKLFSLPLEIGNYQILLEKESFSIAEFTPFKAESKTIELLEFKDRIAELGGVFSQIDLWLTQGILPEQISIVLPNESFVPYLKLFDRARNFNFAMGVLLKDSYLQLEALKNDESLNFKDFKTFREFLLPLLEQNVREKVLNLLEEFELALPYLKNFNTKDQIAAFLKLLESFSVDDVGGGRIRVIGILETRGIPLEYVIIPEFNAQNVPSLSDNDMFLNTSIREKVGLPTRKNREDLQKHYYTQLLFNAKAAKILCLNNDEDKPSRFLLEDFIFQNQAIQKTSLDYSAYFIQGSALHYKERQIIAPLATTTFSPTSLECFLTCKRKYYYRYIQGLKAPETTEVNLGAKIHYALMEVYTSATNFDAESLYGALCKRLEAHKSAREYFDTALAKKYLQKVFAFEKEHLQEGWIPSAFEKDFSFECAGFTLRGRIDRVDKKGDNMLVLDYKYKRHLKLESQKSYANAVDFQLPIYYLALQEEFPNCSINAVFYDLYAADFKSEQDLFEKARILKEKLRAIKEEASEVNFSLREKYDKCQYCDFIYLCNRHTHLKNE